MSTEVAHFLGFSSQKRIESISHARPPSTWRTNQPGGGSTSTVWISWRTNSHVAALKITRRVGDDHLAVPAGEESLEAQVTMTLRDDHLPVLQPAEGPHLKPVYLACHSSTI